MIAIKEKEIKEAELELWLCKGQLQELKWIRESLGLPDMIIDPNVTLPDEFLKEKGEIKC